MMKTKQNKMTEESCQSRIPKKRKQRRRRKWSLTKGAFTKAMGQQTLHSRPQKHMECGSQWPLSFGLLSSCLGGQGGCAYRQSSDALAAAGRGQILSPLKIKYRNFTQSVSNMYTLLTAGPVVIC